MDVFVGVRDAGTGEAVIVSVAGIEVQVRVGKSVAVSVKVSGNVVEDGAKVTVAVGVG
jgi:hypothetical protein